MSRHAKAALVALLLVATALAFVHAERLKLTPSPIVGTRVENKIFSPRCDCDTDVAVVSFVLRKPDVVTIEIVDRSGDLVRSLAFDVVRKRGRMQFFWNGRDDSGAIAADGVYRPRIHLSRARRTIVMPNDLRIDTEPPTVTFASLRPRRISPDGDRRNDRTIIRYRANEPSSVRLLVDGRQQVRKRGQQLRGRLDWTGLIDGTPAEPGTYTLTLVGVDAAGNLGVESRPRSLLVRYVALGREVIRVAAGSRFGVLVRSDAAEIAWRLGPRSGVARPGTLKLRAPAKPGRYRLVVSANGYETRATVIVRERPAP